MKHKIVWIMILMASLSLMLAACQSAGAETAAAPPATAVDVEAEAPAELGPDAAVVLAMVERVNGEDYAGAMEYVADDIKVYLLGMPPTGFEFYDGKAQFQQFLEACCTGQHFMWEVTPQEVEDGIVRASAKTWMDFTRELGVAPNLFNEAFAMRDGKIAMYSSQMTDESLVKFKPRLQEVMPFEPPPLSTDTPVAEMTITFENGTCRYDGPTALLAGDVAVTADVKEQGDGEYALMFFTLDEGKDFIDLMAQTGFTSWSRNVCLEILEAGSSETFTCPLSEGRVYVTCESPEFTVGQVGPLDVLP